MDIAAQGTAIEGFRLSPTQRQIWQAQQEHPQAGFGARATFALDGQLDVARLRRAWAALIERHEVLRTSFAALSGMDMPLQVIAPAAPCPLPLALHPDEAQGEQAALLERRAPDAHLLHLRLPALIADRASLGVLLRDLAVLYAGSDETDEVPQYVDLAEWQHELLEAEETAAGRMFWRQLCAALPPAPPLPWEPQAGDTPVAVEAELPAGTAAAVRASAAALGAEPAVVLLAAWQVLLARATDQEAVVVGLLRDGRAHEELAGAVGPLARYVPVAATLAGQSFAALVAQVQPLVAQATAWQESFRLPEGAPLTWPFAFEYNAPPAPQAADGVSFALAASEVVAAPVQLGLVCEHGADVLRIGLRADPRAAAEGAAQRIAGQYATLLAGLLADPHAPIDRAPLLDAAQREQLALFARSDDAPDTEIELLHRRVERSAQARPDAVAVVADDGSLTYAELNARANRLAHRLREQGVGPETPVVLWQERGAAVLVGMLATLKAGGFYVPLDPGLPRERLALLLEDTAAAVVLTSAALREKLPPTTAAVIALDAEDLSTYPDENPDTACAPEQLAYLIYTSGSTGTPKGVMVAQRQVSHYTAGVARRLGLGEGARYAIVSTFGADLGNTALFGALWDGGAIHIIGHETARTPDAFAAYMRQHAIDCLKIVPSHLGALLVAADGAGVLPRRCLVLGGEAPRPELLASIRALAPECRIVNHYGPTETTVGVLTFAVPADGALPDGARVVPLGRPLPGGTVYVLDANGQPTPIGAVGEVYLGGPGVARGYLKRAAVTAERFVPDPFGTAPGARLYRTGDRARVLSNGAVEFVGRGDDQVKIRGYRVELGEIAGVLAQHPAVADAVAVVRTEGNADPRLVAYLVFAPERKPSLGELKRFAQARLPEYMVPSAFVVLEKLPLTPNGKIDRKALPAPEQRTAKVATGHAAPRTPVEATLAQIWSEVLNKPVGIHDNFFALGGDSILSIQIIAYASQSGLRLTPKQLFDNPTVAQLAALAGSATRPAHDQGRVSGDVPLTPIQRWFFEQEPPAPQHYNQSVLLDLRTPVAPAAIATALEHLYDHHDALRLRFTREGGVWTQTNAEQADPIALVQIDLAALPADEREAARQRAAAELHTGLDLQRGPLLRAALFHQGAGLPDQLLLVVHHLAVDGVSWRILAEDLQTAIEQQAAGEPVALPPKTTSFKRWAEQLAEYARQPACREELAFWQETGAHTPLPRDLASGAPNTVANAATYSCTLTPEDSRALLEDVPAALHTQINDVLLAALLEATSEWTGSPTLLVDMEGHGREEIIPDTDLSRTVGWFTTRYPVLLRKDGADGLATVRAVKEQLRRVPQRGIGYGLLRYGADGETGAQLAAAPQPEISFNYLGQIGSFGSKLLGWNRDTSGCERSPDTPRRHTLDLNGFVTEGRLHLAWTYASGLLGRDTVERLAERFNAALRAIIAASRGDKAHAFTPSDFPQARLSQDQLNAFLARLEEER
ncbi:MAG TPA: amino acid adenylation domain-containing protein [Roseiflexaceae bacterium]|nr:amino acid adenylation domain-containing protein [Roseiflexaceae bacterium]